MRAKNINIVKFSGEKVPYDKMKLYKSLERSGANETLINKVISEIDDLLYEGITTKEIYKKAFALLKGNSRSTAARYKLKRAIIELGPTGYPFEKFVGEILKYQGYQTSVDVLVKGHCVVHEVDVVAVRDHTKIMVECKFHHDQKRRCDVKVPLYINSRFQDVEKESRKKGKEHEKFHEGWIVTNTRFTTDAAIYGNCAGLHLIGWDHPKQGSLRERIDISGLHPVTCLTTITNHEKEQLLDQDVVLCIELLNNPQLLNSIGIKEPRHKRIIDEVEGLCKR